MANLKEVSSDDMISELEYRGDTPIEIEYETEYVNIEVEVEKEIRDLRRHLCDICELGYHASTDEILTKLKEKI